MTNEANITEEVTNEDLNATEVEPTESTEVVEEVEPTESTEVVEEVEPTEVETIEEVEDFGDLDTLLSDEEDNSEGNNTTEVETPTEPTFFPENVEIDENLLTELDESFTELDEEISSLKETISNIEEERDTAKQEAEAFGDGLDTISKHPILGPLSDKLLRGEELNIPDILAKSVEEDIDALPNMENIANEITEVNTPLSLQEKLEKRASQMY